MTLRLPGFVNAHSHSFQRTLRGRTEGGDFWAWRDAMLALARCQTPKLVKAEYVATYEEMLHSGYTAVGEFHYLGFEAALAAAEAADEAGIQFSLLYAAYAAPPFAQPSVSAYLEDVERLRGRGLTVGVAPHSVRACPPDWLEEIGRYADREGVVLHVHACEQPKEVEDCLAAYGVRPIELLARSGCLGPRTTVVHATHANDAELDLLRDAGARVCVCPATEANLGDGFAPIGRICSRGIGVCIGSDSNVRIDPLEELREIEGIARRLTLRRNIVPLERLLEFGSDVGAAAIGIEHWLDITVDTRHASLRGIDKADVPAALVYGCSSEVLAPAVVTR